MKHVDDTSPQLKRSMVLYGKAVEIARKARGFDQANLAKRLGMSQASVSRLESGIVEPTLTQHEAIMTTLFGRGSP